MEVDELIDLAFDGLKESFGYFLALVVMGAAMAALDEWGAVAMFLSVLCAFLAAAHVIICIGFWKEIKELRKI